jgi:hypothetical protein
MPALVTVESLLHARGVWSRVDGDIGHDDARLLARPRPVLRTG